MPLSEFWDCSLWEFSCAVAGYNRAQGGDDQLEGMSAERYDEILAERGY